MKGSPEIVFAASVAVSLAATAQQQKTTVPAFFWVTQQTDGSNYDWMRIASKGTAVLAVVPDGSYTGDTGSCDPNDLQNYCGPCTPSPNCNGASGLCAAKCQFLINANAGQLVLGYVPTNFGCNNQTTVNPQTVSNLVGQWYLKYPTQIQGIFYDIGPTLDTCSCVHCDRNGLQPLDEGIQQAEYDQAYHGVHDPPPQGHSGLVMLNASQFPHEWVMSDPANGPAADYAVTYEQTYDNWSTSFHATGSSGPAPWWTSANYRGQLAHVLYNATQNVVGSAVNRSRTSPYADPTQGVYPVLYLYDGNSTSYGHLSCSFEQQVAALQNQQAVSGTTWCTNPTPACRDINSDASHCGSCSNACTTGVANAHSVCNSGTCSYACNNGYTPCGSACDDLSSDLRNCGACNHACAAPTNGSATCNGGTCGQSCNAGYTLCGTTCANLSSNPYNCGACGSVCNTCCLSGVCQAPYSVGQRCDPSSPCNQCGNGHYCQYQGFGGLYVCR